MSIQVIFQPNHDSQDEGKHSQKQRSLCCIRSRKAPLLGVPHTQWHRPQRSAVQAAERAFESILFKSYSNKRSRESRSPGHWNVPEKNKWVKPPKARIWRCDPETTQQLVVRDGRAT